MIEIIHQLLLASPTAIEIINDRNGDAHKDYRDLVFRTIMIIVMSFASSLLHDWRLFYQWLPECLAMSVAYFVLFFDYGVNMVQRDETERRDWWNYLNKTTWPDNWKPWVTIGWEWRMVVKVIFFGLTLLWYF